MPLWEDYEVEVETKVTVITKGRAIADFTVYTQSRGDSNEQLSLGCGIPGAVSEALRGAAESADYMAEAVRATRRRELGYGD